MSKFKGQRLEVPSTEDRLASDDRALAAVRPSIDDHGRIPTATLWVAPGALSERECHPAQVRQLSRGCQTSQGLADLLPSAPQSRLAEYVGD